jgi:hypothetical protein
LYPDLAELLNFSHPFQNNFRIAAHSLRTPHDVCASSISLKAQA